MKTRKREREKEDRGEQRGKGGKGGGEEGRRREGREGRVEGGRRGRKEDREEGKGEERKKGVCDPSVIRHHDRGDLSKKAFIWSSRSPGLESVAIMAGSTAQAGRGGTGAAAEAYV